MTKKEKMFINDMIKYRGISFARIGMQIEVNGYIGTIMGLNSSGNLEVIFANRLKFGNENLNCHPTWNTRYFDKEGNIIADYTKC